MSAQVLSRSAESRNETLDAGNLPGRQRRSRVMTGVLIAATGIAVLALVALLASIFKDALPGCGRIC